LQQQNIINLQPMQSQLTEAYGLSQCPDNPAAIISECGDSVPCQYDYTTLNAKVLGVKVKEEWNVFTTERAEASRFYNSCGPINIEYPEYLTKTSSMFSAYMQGDVARFECVQSHWIKGVHEYKCGIVVDYNRPNEYRFEWNKGEQPWCRSREKENFLIWLSAILGTIAIIMVSGIVVDYNRPNEYRFEWNKGEQPWCRSREKENFLIWLSAILGTIAIIMAIIFIFLCCWCVKQQKREEKQRGQGYGGNGSSRATSFSRKKFPAPGSLPDAQRSSTICEMPCLPVVEKRKLPPVWKHDSDYMAEQTR
uniref:Sushi domain-containing protein n=2 Tax=Heligmosomoides polygyrus TaxID=6339 RepID=A0A8L8Q4M5_HELPZ